MVFIGKSYLGQLVTALTEQGVRSVPLYKQKEEEVESSMAGFCKKGQSGFAVYLCNAS